MLKLEPRKGGKITAIGCDDALSETHFKFLRGIDGKNGKVYGLPAWGEGVLCVEATPKEFRPLFNAKVDDAGLLNTEDALRELHGINALAKENQGQAEKLYQSKIGKHGPLQCATPAIADGKIYVRLKNALACYDLRTAHRN